MEKNDKKLVEVEVENEEIEELTYDKMYFLNWNKLTITMGKTTLLVILGILMINIMNTDIQWWAKGLFGLGGLFLIMFVYYDVKYMLGLRKNPFMLFPEKKIFRYYNEFEGNKEIDMTNIKEIKVYSRAKSKETFLLEVFLHNQTKEENINVSGYGQETIDDLLHDIRRFNSDFVMTSNHSPKRTDKK